MSTNNINYASPSVTIGKAPTPGAPDRQSIHATLTSTTQSGVVMNRQMRLEQELEAVAPPPAPEPPTPPTFHLPASVVG